jgi:hypothetical protein
LLLLSSDQSVQGVFKTGVIMTSGPMGDDEGLLTEEAAALLPLVGDQLEDAPCSGSNREC